MTIAKKKQDISGQIKNIKLDDLTKNAANETKVLEEAKIQAKPLLKEQSDIEQTNC